MKRKYLYWGLPVLGVLFCLFYIHISTCNVVYSDYIRLVNSYLPDVLNPRKFFVGDLLTRIPINYLGRIVNVELFGFNLQFDRILGVLGLGLSSFVLAAYSSRFKVGPVWYTMIVFLMFSLNKWEMLTNGSGWSHFLAFALFYYHFVVLDRVRNGKEERYDRVRLLVLPFVITLGVAGPYCAVYTATLLLSYGFCLFTDWLEKKNVDKRYLLYMACALIPLLLYLWSNSCLTEDYDKNSVSPELLPTLLGNPKFMIKFFLKSFASMAIGKETAEGIVASSPQFNKVVCLLGAAVIAAYLLALWLNYKHRLYKKTMLPLMLLAAGGMNHVLILVSRWIFELENYGMSSRYALQYQIGMFGIILTFAFVWKDLHISRKSLSQAAIALICCVVLAGNACTTADELKKARYRKEKGQLLTELALDFENRTDEELEQFEYTRGIDKVRNALGILKENHLNVFYEK